MCQNWLKFPKDGPDTYLYAQPDVGGLRIPHLGTTLPFLKFLRLTKLHSLTDLTTQTIVGCPAFDKDLQSSLNLPLRVGDTIVASQVQENALCGEKFNTCICSYTSGPRNVYSWPSFGKAWGLNGAGTIECGQLCAKEGLENYAGAQDHYIAGAKKTRLVGPKWWESIHS